MSHLSLPRLHFKGKFVANVPTGNNDDILELSDMAKVTVSPPEEFETWRAEVDPQQQIPEAELFVRWASQIKDESGRKYIRGGWNYFGDSSCWLKEVTITSVELPGQGLITDPGQDPLIGAAVNFMADRGRPQRAIMVDADPESILSTQIFCDLFQVESADGNLLCQGAPTPFYARWHDPWRNLAFLQSYQGASVVWHAAMPRQKPMLEGGTNTQNLQFKGDNSPSLTALQTAAEAGRGLFIRFCTYAFSPSVETEKLAKQIAEQLKLPLAERDLAKMRNPATGYILGTIGPWCPAETPKEMESVTFGRLLHPRHALTDPETNQSFRLGPAVFQIDRTRKVIVLDMITTFPEINDNLQKIDRGKVVLKCDHKREDQPQPYSFKIPSNHYDRSAYELRGGIVEVGYDPAIEPDLDQGNFRLSFEGVNHDQMVEFELAVETDERTIYLQEGEQKTITLQVFRKGKPLPEPVSIELEQYVMTNINQAKPQTPIPPHSTPPEKHILEMLLDEQGAQIVGDKIQVKAGGIYQLTLRAKEAGSCVIRFKTEEQGPNNLLQMLTACFFINVRVLPADTEIGTTLEPTFGNIYQEILRYYQLIYPATGLIDAHKFMNTDLNGVISAQVAAEIKQRINSDLWSRYLYMPRTRDLSKGKRKLLEKWCEAILKHNISSST